jgi:hypothetical protein
MSSQVKDPTKFRYKSATNKGPQSCDGIYIADLVNFMKQNNIPANELNKHASHLTHNLNRDLPSLKNDKTQ